MHLKVMACEIAFRELSFCAARSKNTVDIEFLTQGLHDNPQICLEELQERIDHIPMEKYHAVLLGYGLCNNSLVGITARDLPVVIPRAHDCITLLMGSKERYKDSFIEQPGTYYYTAGWLEHRERKGERVERTQSSGLGPQRSYEELVEQYGEDNARYIVETMGKWQANYTRGLFIDFEFAQHLDCEAQVRKICEERGWKFDRMEGDLSLLQRLLDGQWDSSDFLVIEPGQRVHASYDDAIIGARDGCP